jgi:hypothetical protein
LKIELKLLKIILKVLEIIKDKYRKYKKDDLEKKELWDKLETKMIALNIPISE